MAAALNRYVRCRRRMSASWRRVVTRGWPDRGRSFTLPVVSNLRLSLDMVDGLQLKVRATSLGLLPALSMPIASDLSCCDKRGIFPRNSESCLCCFFNMPVTRVHIHAFLDSRIDVPWAPRAIYAKSARGKLATTFIHGSFHFFLSQWHYVRTCIIIAKHV